MDFSANLANYGYAFIILFTFLECGAFVGLFVPGESLLILSGVLASQGRFHIAVVIACAFVGAFAGDLFGYWLGRRFGHRLLLKIAGRLGYHQDHFARTERFFLRWGMLAIIAGRFIGIFRSLLPATVGTISYPVKKFILADLLGSLLWATFFGLVGFTIGEQWLAYSPWFLGAGVLIVLVSIMINIFRRTSTPPPS